MSIVRLTTGGGLMLMLGMGLSIGCGAVKAPPRASAAEENLSTIGRAYMTATGGLKRPPKNAKELVPFLEKAGASESVLRSPRDGQDYVILWDVKPANLAPKPPQQGLSPHQRFPILAYEKVGEGGSRFVLQVPNRIALLTQEELTNAYFPSGHKPPR